MDDVIDKVKDELRLAILQKMLDQITDIKDNLASVRPPSMSADTHQKTLRDVEAQRDALEWAHTKCWFYHKLYAGELLGGKSN